MKEAMGKKIEKLSRPLMVTESSIPKHEDYAELIKTIWERKWLTNQGQLHNELMEELKRFLGVRNVTLFVNGHLALDVAMKSLRKLYPEPGAEIITTPFTFVSTTHAIAMNGFKPVFCDIKMSDYTIDEEQIESLITEKTVAIAPVHVYGYPCNVKAIQEIVERHGLKVIYDAAHAFNVKVNGEAIGNCGDISMCSFHATKVFNTIEGGMLNYNDDSLRQEFDLLKNFGILNEEEIVGYGLNAKMNEFQAAMGLLNLKEVEKNIAHRKEATEIYYRELAEAPGIVLAKHRSDVEYNYAYMPILVEEKEFGRTRDELKEKLAEYNVFTRKYFYPLISNLEIYRDLGAEVPKANYVAERILCLPMYGEIDLEDVRGVCEMIKAIGSR